MVSSSGLRGPPSRHRAPIICARIRAVSGKTKGSGSFPLSRRPAVCRRRSGRNDRLRNRNACLSLLHGDAPAALPRSCHAFHELAPTVCYAVKANGNIAVIATLASGWRRSRRRSRRRVCDRACSGRSRRPDRLFRDRQEHEGDALGAARRRSTNQRRVGAGAGAASTASPANSVCAHPRRCASTPMSMQIPTTRFRPVVAKISSASSGLRRTASIRRRGAARPGSCRCRRAHRLTTHGSRTISGGVPPAARSGCHAARRRAANPHLDLGGGLGIPHGNEDASPPSPEDYARVAAQTVGDLGCRIIVEPGRMLVGNAGVLVTRVLRVKEGSTRTFVIVDAGMNDLLRPALYGAWHAVVPVLEPAPGSVRARWTLSGPSARRATFSVAAASYRRWVPGLVGNSHDGAYGRAMASSYNARPLPPEVLRRQGELGDCSGPDNDRRSSCPPAPSAVLAARKEAGRPTVARTMTPAQKLPRPAGHTTSATVACWYWHRRLCSGNSYGRGYGQPPAFSVHS